MDGYILFDLIVSKWGVPYGVELRRMEFAGKNLLYINVMWKYLGQQSFPLSEQQYLEHLVRNMCPSIHTVILLILTKLIYATFLTI